MSRNDSVISFNLLITKFNFIFYVLKNNAYYEKSHTIEKSQKYRPVINQNSENLYSKKFVIISGERLLEFAAKYIKLKGLTHNKKSIPTIYLFPLIVL
jgi:hypothetical protein